MRFRSLLGYVAAATLMLLPQWVAAQEQKKADDDPGGLFARLDANKDGQITADEISADRKSFFERMLRVNDKNGDGKLSKEEFAQGTRAGDRPNWPAEGERRPQAAGDAPDAAALFKRMDANSDGKLVPDEIPEDRRAQFRENLARADKDNDGALTLEEFRAIVPQLARRPGAQPPPTTPAPAQPPGTPEGRPNFANAPFFRVIDTNADGRISAEELAGAAAALKTLDRNQDGYLTPEEMVPPRSNGSRSSRRASGPPWTARRGQRAGRASEAGRQERRRQAQQGRSAGPSQGELRPAGHQ